jgi:regulator of nonsense transcripts 1
VIGREERTNAERAQYHFLLHSLIVARRIPLFVNIIWFPGNIEGMEHGGESNLSCDHSLQILKRPNDSQRGIVHAMLSTAPQDSLVIAHGMHNASSTVAHARRRRRDCTGPPGTGKTTTIAAAAAIWVSNKLPCWIIAQSNVGVKNIAEKLFKEKVNFKLIVSHEFLFEW